MTDLDKNHRSEHFYPSASQLPITAIGFEGATKGSCSSSCQEQDLSARWVFAPVFVAPRPLNLRDHLLSELASNCSRRQVPGR